MPSSLRPRSTRITSHVRSAPAICRSAVHTYFGTVVRFELDAVQSRTMLALPHVLYIFRKQNELANTLLTIVDAIVADASHHVAHMVFSK